MPRGAGGRGARPPHTRREGHTTLGPSVAPPQTHTHLVSIIRAAPVVHGCVDRRRGGKEGNAGVCSMGGAVGKLNTSTLHAPACPRAEWREVRGVCVCVWQVAGEGRGRRACAAALRKENATCEESGGVRSLHTPPPTAPQVTPETDNQTCYRKRSLSPTLRGPPPPTTTTLPTPQHRRQRADPPRRHHVRSHRQRVRPGGG